MKTIIISTLLFLGFLFFVLPLKEFIAAAIFMLLFASQAILVTLCQKSERKDEIVYDRGFREKNSKLRK